MSDHSTENKQSANPPAGRAYAQPGRSDFYPPPPPRLLAVKELWEV